MSYNYEKKMIPSNYKKVNKLLSYNCYKCNQCSCNNPSQRTKFDINVNEIFMAREIIKQAQTELKNERKDFTDKYLLGIMVEVPACALQADTLSKHIDFMSIGTNDLVQYTLAIDRIDDEVSNLYDPTEPAVLNLIKKVIDACNKAEIDVSVCGEMAGETFYTKVLLGLGLTSFSMHPKVIPEVKSIILNSDTNKIRKAINKVLKCDNRIDRENLIRNL